MFAVTWLPDTPFRTISFSLGTAAMSAVGGIAATRLVAYRGIIWAAWGRYDPRMGIDDHTR